MAHKYKPEGATEEIEVYTAEEVKAREDAAVKTKEEDWGKTKTQIESERDEARKALGERAGEFKQFRKLTEDQAAKLSVAERTIYENQKYISDMHDKQKDVDKKNHETQRDTILRAKAGKDEKVFVKLLETYNTFNIEANTPEEMDRKANMAIGALRVAEPDLLASANGAYGGSWTPPKPAGQQDGKSFGDTDQGKAIAKELGITLEVPKK